MPEYVGKTENPVVVTEPTEKIIPPINDKEVIKIVNDEIKNGNIKAGAKLYLHDILVTDKEVVVVNFSATEFTGSLNQIMKFPLIQVGIKSASNYFTPIFWDDDSGEMYVVYGGTLTSVFDGSETITSDTVTEL